MTAQIIHLPPHDKLSVEEALEYAKLIPWSQIIIIGIDDDDDFQSINSEMRTSEGNWLLDIAKLHLLEAIK